MLIDVTPPCAGWMDRVGERSAGQPLSALLIRPPHPEQFLCPLFFKTGAECEVQTSLNPVWATQHKTHGSLEIITVQT